MPARSAPRRAFTHGLELGSDLLQCAVGRGRLNTGDQPDQPVVAALRSGALQQVRLDDAFGGQPPYRSAQPLDRPVGRLHPVQDPHDVTQGWPGRMRRTVGSHEFSCARTPSR